MADITDYNFNLFIFVTFWSLFNAFIPLMVKVILNVFLNETKMETSLRRQIRDLKTELSDISMSDEFAKYAKIDRKLNKAKDQLKSQSDSQTIVRIKARVLFYVIFYSISAVVTVYLLWNYRYEVLFRIPEHLFYPFGFILAFPTGVSGAIGITSWTAITTFIGRNIVNLIS
ncbi:guided entry of tail-anchored proteins factor 1-like [Oppia nitens]|uniref:guided entry of tail-anchored proteins factor 1-like n=1 Tax=Oppia nitens TaxID=1686743 RepID=UPI0023DC9DFE|nr:guided entry of tail-anchored proteins factor 1-like [Oppia nitens]XP_054163534.1 guided entry of tail-anchored proteins factor 1-like [Oppia nitens]